MKKVRLLIFLFIIAVLTLPTIQVSADTPNPDTTPTIERMNIYRNLLSSGDSLLVWAARIPYFTPPPSKIGDTFYWELFEADGTTPKAYTVGYAYHENGFNYNIYSMYFGPSDGYVWGTVNYVLKLIGTTSAFTTPPSYNFSIAATAYTSLTAQADNRTALENEVIYLAQYLNSRWGLTGDNSLILSSEVKTVLSLAGEDVFRSAIYGVQGMAPGVFRFYVGDTITATDRSWNGTYVTSLENQYAGTWVETAQNASRAFFGLDFDLLGLVLFGLACLVLFIGNISITGDHWNALIDISFILVIATRIGVVGLVYSVLLFVVAIIYIGMRLYKMIPT